MLTATDGQVSGGGGVDTFRIKIWDKNNADAIIYDNQLGEADDIYAGTALGGGSIVIHSRGAKSAEQAGKDAELPEKLAGLFGGHKQALRGTGGIMAADALFDTIGGGAPAAATKVPTGLYFDLPAKDPRPVRSPNSAVSQARAAAGRWLGSFDSEDADSSAALREAVFARWGGDLASSALAEKLEGISGAAS
jgi:hypothetical protein